MNTNINIVMKTNNLKELDVHKNCGNFVIYIL